jgi:hypothetical protein
MRITSLPPLMQFEASNEYISNHSLNSFAQGHNREASYLAKTSQKNTGGSCNDKIPEPY